MRILLYGAAARRGQLSRLRTSGGVGQGGKLFLPDEQLRRPAAEVLRGKSRLYPAGIPQKRNDQQLYQAGSGGSGGIADHV
ncbi:hypothetical protein D1872_233760 [compost metagenome]